MQSKLLRRIIAIMANGKLITLNQGERVYSTKKGYIIKDSNNNEIHKYPKLWVSELHKANTFNNDTQVISL